MILLQCKFAEVKGQHDKLRPKQILWLRFLVSIGADAELCHVHSKLQSINLLNVKSEPFFNFEDLNMLGHTLKIQMYG